MNLSPTLAFFGGDRRMEVAAARMKEIGYSVFSIGIGQDASPIEEEAVSQLLDRANVLILPTPCSMDDRTIHSPVAKQRISWTPIRASLTASHLIIGGKIPPAWRNHATEKGASIMDITESDRLALKNALPTAEGALAIALQTMPRTLNGANAVLIGYGRISRALAPMLLALGARVTVCARRAEARAEASAIGCTAIDFSALPQACSRADWLCNTVPDLMLDREALSHCRRDVLILDLASKPGGVDRVEAEKQGIPVIWALGLPGKVAPISAGEYLAEEIVAILQEREVQI